MFTESGQFFTSGGGYEIDQSIRFNDDDSAYLSRTFSTPTDGKTFTWSGWVKRGNIDGASKTLMSGGGSAEGTIYLHNEALEMYGWTGSAYSFQVWSSPVLRDPSAWYHLVVIYDSTEATSSNRVRLYVNGVEITAFQVSSYPGLNSTTYINSASAHRIGYRVDNAVPWDGYMAEINFIDGQALAPTSFGETNDDGVWIPKAYDGSYGDNGFYITGEDSADLGADYSGNGNDFTSSGLTSDDQVTDTPTNNYATWNPLDSNNGVTFSDGNKTLYTATGFDLVRATYYMSTGLWYWEVACTDTGAGYVGVTDAGTSLTSRGDGTIGGAMIRSTTGNLYWSSADQGAYAGAITDGTRLKFAYDADNGKFYAGTAGGAWFNSGDPVSGTGAGRTGMTASVSPSVGLHDNEDYIGYFAEDEWTDTPPTGFSALSTANLPAPAIKDGSAYFQTTLYTATGSALEVNQVGNSTFQPDFVWVKNRTQASGQMINDAVTGAQKFLRADTTAAQTTETQGLVSFDADGFSVGTNGDFNYGTDSFVGWQWLAGNGTASNEDGSINTIATSVNTTAGISISTYTGNATSGATFGHGLGVKPSMVIVKILSGADNWQVYHEAIGATKYLQLNTTIAAGTASVIWNNTEPTSTLISLGNGSGVNQSSGTFVAYCFAEVEGFSKFGSYTGNGSTDGSFIYTGFKPAFVIFKRIDSADNWAMYDATRDPYNVAGKYLYADTNAGEATYSTAKVDFLSNGFKWRGAVNFGNNSSGTYIYMAWAAHPFGGDGVAPATAR